MARSPFDVIQVVSPPDRLLIELACDLMDQQIVDHVGIMLAPKVDQRFENTSDIRDFAKRLDDLSGSRIRQMRLHTQWSAVCKFDRGVTVGDILQPSVFQAEFYFQSRDSSEADIEALTAFAAAIDKHCGSASRNLGAEGDSLVGKALSAQVERLFEVSASVSKELSKAQTAYDQRLLEHQDKLERQAEAQEEQREAEFQRRKEVLEKKSAVLDEKLSEIDLRRARDARRKLRDDITTGLKERVSNPGPSSTIYVFRYLIVILSVLGAIAAAGAAFFASQTIAELDSSSGPPAVYLAYARFFGSTALAAILIFYVLGYLKKLELEDVRFERDLERYSLDINRASWVIETVMEFRDEEGGLSVPPKWLEGATANLFERPESEIDEDQSALESLGELLRAGAKLRIGSDGAEIEIDSRTAKKVARSAD